MTEGPATAPGTPTGDSLGRVGVEGSLFVSPQIAFSGGGPGHGGHQLPRLGLNDPLGGSWGSLPAPMMPTQQAGYPVETALLTGLPFQKHFRLRKTLSKVSSLGRC